MTEKVQPYEENGIMVSKTKLYTGDEIALTYKGLLAQHGAQDIFVHVGYGEQWEDKDFIPMEKAADVFACSLKVLHPGTLNVCFKDNADHWDNNSQMNYTFKVANKAARSAKPAPIKEGIEVAIEARSRTKAADTKKSVPRPKAAKSKKEEQLH